MRAGTKLLLLGFLGLLMLWGSLGVGRFSVEAAPAPQAQPTATRPPVPPLATVTPVPAPPQEDSDARSEPAPPTPTSTPATLLPEAGGTTRTLRILWLSLGLLIIGAVTIVGLGHKTE
jgi:hypothetical protein